MDHKRTTTHFLFRREIEDIKNGEIGLHTLITSYQFMKKGQIEYSKISSAVNKINNMGGCEMADLEQIRKLTNIKSEINMIDILASSTETLRKIMDGNKRKVIIFHNEKNAKITSFVVCHEFSIFHVIDFEKKVQHDFASLTDAVNYINDIYKLSVSPIITQKYGLLLMKNFDIGQLWQYLTIDDKFDFDYSYIIDNIITPQPVILDGFYDDFDSDLCQDNAVNEENDYEPEDNDI